MSERKTSEIKLRVTPSFKAAVQLAAEQAGETMSVYMEKATDDRMRTDLLQSPLPAPVDWAKEEPFATDFNSPVAQPVPIETGAADPQCLGALGDVEFVPAKCEKNCSPWQWCPCRAEK